jgi:hypothetical protein
MVSKRMPLSTLQDYDRLGEHLREIDPILEDFCRETGFSRQTQGVSRYPMRRLVLHRDVSWFIELRMEEDERGQRYDQFFADIPYSLSGGAWIDLSGFRYGDIGYRLFSRMPFRAVPPRLAESLRETWQHIGRHTTEYLVSLGPRVKLDLHPKVQIVGEDEDET